MGVMTSLRTYDVISDVIQFYLLVCLIYPPYGGKTLVVLKNGPPYTSVLHIDPHVLVHRTTWWQLGYNNVDRGILCYTVPITD